MLFEKIVFGRVKFVLGIYFFFIIVTPSKNDKLGITFVL